MRLPAPDHGAVRRWAGTTATMVALPGPSTALPKSAESLAEGSAAEVAVHTNVHSGCVTAVSEQPGGGRGVGRIDCSRLWWGPDLSSAATV